MSCGNTATPTGTGHGSVPRGVSRDSLAEEAAVAVSQYSETPVSIRSSLIGERGSVHCAHRAERQGDARTEVTPLATWGTPAGPEMVHHPDQRMTLLTKCDAV